MQARAARHTVLRAPAGLTTCVRGSLPRIHRGLGAIVRPTIGDERPNTQFKAAQGPATIGFAEIARREAIGAAVTRGLTCNI